MELKLEVKKLEKRETKEDTPYTWACGINPNIISVLMDDCMGGCGC